MDKVDALLSPVSRKGASLVRKEFPSAAHRYCSCREGKFCGLTGERCEFGRCPKIKVITEGEKEILSC